MNHVEWLAEKLTHYSGHDASFSAIFIPTNPPHQQWLVSFMFFAKPYPLVREQIQGIGASLAEAIERCAACEPRDGDWTSPWAAEDA